jgi:hypothetical protein
MSECVGKAPVFIDLIEKFAPFVLCDSPEIAKINISAGTADVVGSKVWDP